MFFDKQGRRVPPPTPAAVSRTPMSELMSRCTVTGYGAADRVDPYWDGVFGTGSQAYWDSAKTLRRSVDAGLGGHRFTPTRTPAEAVERLCGTYNWKSKLRSLAAVEMWRTLTGEQVTAISGHHGFTDHGSHIMRDVFESGLFDLGSWATPLRAPTSKDWLLRPSRGSAKVFDRQIAPALTYPEWVSVTGGQGWEQGGQFTRHNVLAVELALRVAEFCDIGTVLGEKLATVDLLAGVGAGRDIVHDNRSADAVLVRTDGLRVAVELTASVSPAFKSKVERWAQLLSSAPFAGSGLVVMFVVADPGLVSEDMSALVRDQAAKTIRSASLQYPGQVGDRVAERMLLVDWRDWFPASGQVGDGFRQLAAKRPTGPAGDPWEPVDVLGVDRLPFEPWDRAAMLEVLVNAQGLAGVPVWLRDPDRGRQMWPELQRLAGVARVPELPAKGVSGRRGEVPDRLLML